MNQNNVAIAVDRVGGATKAAHLMKVSNWTIHSWVRNGKVPKIDQARALAEASGMQVEQLRPTL